MKIGTAFALAALFSACAFPAKADQAEVREVARLNNCPPKKIEVFQQSLGPEGQTIYKVQCNMPKLADEKNKGADALMIGCQDSLCELLRPYQDEKK
ncbi:MAG: hypothetical protein M3N08_06750 [Pseudomonadota bacterium]|nr:hypothetical protein [Pseudomonadota bacterium]